MRLPTRSIASGIYIALTAALLGCPHVPAQTGVLTTVEQPAVTVIQLKMRVFATGQQVGATIQTAADSILSRDTTRRVRERALLWKLSAIPAAQEASLNNDPGVAALDLWAFAVQQRNYFCTGDGRGAFGAEQPIATAAAHAIEEDVRGLIAGIRTANTVPEPTDAKLEEWAAQYPMYGPDMHRMSVLGANWKRLGVSSTTIGSAVARVEQSLTDLNQRVGYLNLGLLDRVGWQAQLASEGPWASRLDTLADDMSITMREVRTLAANAPATIDAERRIAFHDLDGMRERVFASIDEQRVATLDALHAERVAIGDNLQKERVAAFAQADSIAQRSIDHADAVVRRLVRDVALLLASLLVLGGVIADIVVTRAKKERTVRA